MERACLSFVFAFLSFCLHGQSPFRYISPLPGSSLHTPEARILLRTGEAWLKTEQGFCTIRGEITGMHAYSEELSDDGLTLIITPHLSFIPGEEVTLCFLPGKSLPAIPQKWTSSFRVSPWNPIQRQEELNRYYADETEFGQGGYLNKNGFDSLVIDINNNPEPGNILFHLNRSSIYPDTTPHPTVVLASDGTEIYKFSHALRGNCFMPLATGHFTWYDFSDSSWELLDTGFNVIKRVKCVAGYSADSHDFIESSNSHYYLMAYDPQPYDMSKEIQGGNPNAIVVGLVLQELDKNLNLVFQWRSWDHFNITDAIHTTMTLPRIDYVHANSIELDHDSNLILSSRHLDEITKISRADGHMIWRFGGVNNQFAFMGNKGGFNFQHDARRLSNGNLTLFDNGNYHMPQLSSAQEYKLDEVNKKAELIWKYVHPDSIYARAMGNVQRLSGGSTWINWGFVNPRTAAITEVKADGTISWQAHFTGNNYAYRSYRIGKGQPNSLGKQAPARMLLFPNPVSRLLYTDGHFRYELLDGYGRPLGAGEISAVMPLDVSFLRPGVYFLRLEGEEGIRMIPVVKQ